MKYSNFCFRLVTDYGKKTKEIRFALEVDNFEVMASALQIKVISRFVVQVLEFKKIL